VSVVVKKVVGQFESVKGHQHPHPVISISRRVLVNVDPAGYSSFGLASRQPLRRLEAVAVSAVVDRRKVDSDGVLTVDVKA